jgi:hypothetical protein
VSIDDTSAMAGNKGSLDRVGGQAPHSTDFVIPRPGSLELGLAPMSLDEFRQEATNVPFEPGFYAISLMATRLWPIWMDAAKQIELAIEMWGEIPLVEIFPRLS